MIIIYKLIGILLWSLYCLTFFIPDVLRVMYLYKYNRGLNTKVTWQVIFVWDKWKGDLKAILEA